MNWWDEQFELQSQLPDFWFLQAQRLRHAAEILAEKHSDELSKFSESPADFLANQMRDGSSLSPIKTAPALWSVPLA